MTSFFRQHTKIVSFLIILIVFSFSFGVHFSVYRSNNFIETQYYNLLIARNWAQTGQFSYENPENVVLSSTDVKTQGVPSNLGDKLTIWLYGYMFRVFGFQPELPLYASLILYSLATVFIFLIVQRIFSLREGLVSVGILNLAPFALPYSQLVARQEWAWFFLTLATLFYFWSRERKNWHLILTGLLLGLAVGAKNSFFVAVPPFIILEFWQQKNFLKVAFKKTVLLSTIFLIVALPLMFSGGSNYLSEMFGVPNKYYSSFSDFVHLFPDPYTFHHDKENYIQTLLAQKDQFSGGEFRLWGDVGDFLEEYGYNIGFFKAEIVTRVFSLWIYIKGLFLSLIVFGGLLTWFLILLGIKESINKKRSDLVLFGSVFFVSWLFFLVLLKTSNYVQFLSLALPITILVSLGLVRLADFIAPIFNLPKMSRLLSTAIILIFLISFAQISWWSIRELSANNSEKSVLINFSKKERARPTVNWETVTMSGYAKDSTDLLAYYLNKSFIYFSPTTIKKLAENGTLNQVMKNYNISDYIGFDESISKIIEKNTVGLKKYEIN